MRASRFLYKINLGAFVPLTKPNPLLELMPKSRVQTDGSFKLSQNKLSRTAVILLKPDGEKHTLCSTYFTHANSHESEWCSVLDGIEFSKKKGSQSINLENDNLGVITSLISQKKPSGLYSDYYYQITDLAKEFEWLGIRWIPRELNRADDLFRLR
jgi:ribonuclease HI